MKSVDKVRLSDRLFRSGIRFVQVALTAYGNGERDVFAMHAAVGIEHLVKARLAAINPLLIFEWRQRNPPLEAMLWLADMSKHGQPVPPSLRTIGAADAFDLLKRRAAIGRHEAVLRRLREYRNGISHFGEADLEGLIEMLPMILDAVVELSDGLTEEPHQVFGDHQEFAETQLAEWDREEDREYHGRCTLARQRVMERHPHLTTPDVRTAIAAAITSQFKAHRSTFDEQLIDCPACTLPAYLFGSLRIDYEPDYDKDGVLLNAYPVGEYHAARLECPTCWLVLDSPSLIDRSHVLENWHVPYEDIQEIMLADAEAAADHYPDYG